MRSGREDTIQEATKKKWKKEEKSVLMGKLYVIEVKSRQV